MSDLQSESDKLNNRLDFLLGMAKSIGGQAQKDLRTFLQDHPELWGRLINLDQFIIDRTLTIGRDATLEETFRVKAETLRNDLGWDNSPTLIKLGINSVVVAYLKWIMTEYVYSLAVSRASITLNSANFWSKQALNAQRVYLRSLETLAKLKRLSYSCPELANDFTEKTEKKALLM